MAREGPSSTLTAERLIAHNFIVAAGTFSAGLLGFAFQALISHRLPPADYGSVFAVLSILTLIGLPGGALTLLMARQTSRDRAAGQMAASAALLRGANQALIVGGCAFGLALAAASPWLGSFFNVPANLLIAVAAGLPLGLGLPLLLGELQGQQRFVAYASLAGGQAALKLLAALVLGVLWGPFGVVFGISLSTALIYLVALRLVRRKLALRARLSWFRPALSYLALVVPSTLALAVLLGADVLLVKHFFPPRQAGQYAAVVALSRAIYYGAGGIAAVLFPKVIFRETQGKSGAQLVLLSLALVVLGGGLGLIALLFTSGVLLTAFAGSAYVAAAGYLPGYAVGMTLLGAGAVLVATHQSRGKPGFLAILLPVAALEPAAVAVFHQSLMQVVAVVDISMGLLTVSLAGLYLLDSETRSKAARQLILEPQVAEANR